MSRPDWDASIWRRCLLSLGVHPKVVQELLGHSQIAITLDTYSHSTPTLQRAAVEQLGRLLEDGESTAADTERLETSANTPREHGMTAVVPGATSVPATPDRTPELQP